MLIFHEGLPRSGKSYEAMVRHIIPALQAGRAVYAYIEGIDHQRVAEASELPLSRVDELLHHIQRQDVLTVHDVVADNAFVVLDEAQNFWPSGREKLPPAMMQFVTEHGHRGLDILLMGQDIRDVHSLWRRRVSQKVAFHKLDAVGQENRYNATVYKATAPEKFEKVTAVLGTYDPKYFGTYASHVSNTVSTANYADPRATIRNTWFVKWGLPIAGGALIFGIYGTWKFFHQEPKAAPAATATGAPAPTVRQVESSPALPPSGKQRKPFIEDLNDKYRPRLSFVYERQGAYIGAIEWWDGDQLRERLTFVEIAQIGAKVDVRGGLVKVADTWVTPWPKPVQRAPGTNFGAAAGPVTGIVSALSN